MTGRPDYGSRTEADAAAYEAAHSERPSRLEQAIEDGYDPADWREGDR